MIADKCCLRLMTSRLPFSSPGIGVPIMLAYVYGVVPISLCRGGGCGVSRGKGRGMRIDFDEDDGPITGELVNTVTVLLYFNRGPNAFQKNL